MSEDTLKIAKEIRKLADDLIQQIEKDPKKSVKAKRSVKSKTTLTKGGSGALNILMDEGFFDKPKELKSVMERLQEIGRYYSRQSISMNLLSLTKRRILNRFKDKSSKNWVYVIRK